MANAHETISKRPEEGSGRWFLTSLKFRDWQSGNSKLLWRPGIPGAGKTVMASIVVDYLRQQRTKKEVFNKEVGIVMMYLKYNDNQQTLESILGSLLAQLAQEHTPLPTMVRDMQERHRAYSTSPTLSDILMALSEISKTYRSIYVILDALDECSDEVRWALLEKIQELEPTVHLLVTSRSLESIEEELRDFEQLQIKANKADLELFIDQHIKKNKNLQRVVQKSPAMSDDIKDAVVTTAEDMYSSLVVFGMVPCTDESRFLLARLHVESLSSAAALSIKHVRKKLQSLPKTLAGTYDEAMQRIEAQEPDHSAIALKTLAWVSYAFRSLSLGELQHALAIEPDSTEMDEEDIMDGNSITALCAGLVIVDQVTNVVALVHYTAKNYFEEIRAQRFPGFHATITLSCATYLALTALENANLWTIVRQHPLACYAAQYMGDHARHNPEETLETSVLEVIGRLLSHPEKRKPLLSLLDGLDLINSGFYLNQEPPDDPELAGMDREPQSTPKPGSASKTQRDKAEEVAVEVADIDLISISLTDESLISTKATTLFSSQEQDSDTSSSSVSDGGCATESAPELWYRRTSVSRMPEVTALHLAASMGLAKVASLLIKESGDIDAVDETGKTALALAMDRGFEKAVEFLINSGANVDLGSEHGQGIFLLVTERHWTTVADIMSQKTISALATMDSVLRCRAQLLLAAYNGNDCEVGNLVEQGSGLSQGAKYAGATALFIAVERKHVGIVRTLLSFGVDVNSRDSMGQSSLHRAAHGRSKEIISFLIEHGAEIDSQNDDGRTPWSANVRGHDEPTLRLLLDRGADPSTQGHQGVSELYIAAQNGETSVVKLMLNSGTDPSIRTQFGWAPLHWAAYYGHIDCVSLLIDAHAELSPVSDQDATPLDLALRANQVEIVVMLARAGAKEGRDIQNIASSTLRVHDEPTKRKQRSASDAPMKIALTFDKPIQQGLLVGQFIYASTLSNATEWIYQLLQPLETSSTVLSFRQAQRRADMVEYPLEPEQYDTTDILYNIWRSTVDYQQLELRGGRQSKLPGIVTMHRDWSGGWKARHNHKGESEYLFRTTPDWSKMKEEGCRWMTEEGKLLARTGIEDVTPTLCFEIGLERGIQDVLVACWVGKLWSETVALPRRNAEKPPQP